VLSWRLAAPAAGRRGRPIGEILEAARRRLRRLDPCSDARIPQATGYDLHLIVMCAEGYSSSLAAASLQELGLRRATDMAGGFIAWAEAGLPILPVTR
jgi:hypothetical protein